MWASIAWDVAVGATSQLPHLNWYLCLSNFIVIWVSHMGVGVEDVCGVRHFPFLTTSISSAFIGVLGGGGGGDVIISFSDHSNCGNSPGLASAQAVSNAAHPSVTILWPADTVLTVEIYCIK